MVDADSKTPRSPPPPSPTLDSPPSYTFALAEASTSAPPAPAAPPKDTLHLFSGPPNAEPLLGRARTPEDVLRSITTTTRGKTISSADPRLQNAGVLYDWIRYQALAPRTLKVRCEGIHFETPERDEIIQDTGGQRHRRKGQVERVVDFEFTIDLSTIISHPDNFANIHLSSVMPDIPVARGTHDITYSALFAPAQSRGYAALAGPLDAGAVATSAEVALRKEWVAWRIQHGLPPWIKMEEWSEFWDSRGKGKAIALGEGPDEERALGDEVERIRSDLALKAWCDKYVADQGMLKEFAVPVFLWGWDWAGLEAAIKGAINSTGYNSNHIKVSIEPDVEGYVVRPRNYLSRAVNQPVLFTLLCITLIYPMIWIWQRCHRLGGAPYNVSRISYGLKYYPPLPATFAGEDIEAASERLHGMYKVHPELPKPTTLVYGPKGVHYLLGRKEGEWFREWEERIRMGVRMRFRGELQGGGEEAAGAGLDGY